MLIPETTLLPDWLGMGLVLAILGGLMASLRLYQRWYSPHPELVRKLLHVGMGLVTLSFPWVFSSPWPVVLLAGMSIALLLGVKLYKPLKQELGSVTDGVGRDSFGEIYFPLSVALLFILSAGDAILFGIPMLVLTLADAVAALIGVRYGLLRYTTSEGQKSAEGSIAFFTVAFLSTHIPLLLLTDTGRAHTLMISLTLGLLVMLLEAIAWQGLDNLFIPLGGFIMLTLYLDMDVNALFARVCVTLILVIFTLSWRDRTTLNDSAILGAAFVGYLSWALGDWHWLISPLILFFSYTILCPWTKQYPQRRYNILAVLGVSCTCLLWVVLAKIFHHSEFFYPYTLACAANVVIIDIAVPKEHGKLPSPLFAVKYIIKGWSLIFIPFFVMEGFRKMAINYAAISLLGVTLVAIAFCILQAIMYTWEDDNPLWFSRAGVVAAGSFIGLVPLYWLMANS